MLWGVGPKTEARLAELGIHTIGDIAAWPENDLAQRWGENGRDLHRRALGIDDRPISTEREAKSISQETTFSRDVRDDHELEKTLRQLAEQVGYQLRENELSGRTIKLKLRWPDFTTLTRQTTLASPTDNDGVISEAAIKLMKTVRRSNQYVRLIGVGVSGLGRPVRQLGLWDADAQKAQRLQSAVDELREKFGRRIIHHGDRP
jgi:DNA polymerase-4